MYQQPCDAYRRTQVETATPERLVLMLYDGAVRFAGEAVTALKAGQMQRAHAALLRTQAIIEELAGALDFDVGPIAGRLYGLYQYMLRRLEHANLKKDAAAAGEVAEMLRSLGDAWRQAAANVRAEGLTGRGGAAGTGGARP
jgi:flagellar protein FliS